jgi:TolB-like protein/tetratricopeptide (TPR) repeat protein
MAFVSEIKRRNVHRMAILYGASAWLIMQVVDVVQDQLPLPDWFGLVIIALLAIGFPIALIISWFYELTPEGISHEADVTPGESIRHVTSRRMDFVVIALLAAAVLVFAYDKWWLSDPPDQSVAILPFVNLSGDPENDYLSDGISETLLTAIAKLPGLKVPARTSSFFFKDLDVDIRKIAAQLDVAYVLVGSVQRDGDKLRIAAQLTEAESGFHRWSETYDRDMTDIFAVQNDIATRVARAMQVALSGGNINTDNVAAYLKYLQGLEQKNKTSNTYLLQAETSFKTALALDPDFFEARLELASTYAAQASYGQMSSVEANKKLGPLLEQLLEERPDNGRALNLAIAVEYSRAELQGDGFFDLEKHLAQLSAAIERTPNEAGLYVAIAGYLRDAGRRDEFAEWVERGIAVDPLNWALHMFRGGHLLYEKRDLKGAQAALARSLELNPDNPTVLVRMGTIHWQRGEFADWFAMNRKAIDLDLLDAEVTAGMSIALSWFELFDEADKYLDRAVVIAPENEVVRTAKLCRLLSCEPAGARDQSEALLRADIENRFDAYWWAAVVFVSTMTELGETHAALAVLEELQPDVTSPDFEPQNQKQLALQYVAVLALAQTQSRKQTLQLLEAVVPRWDTSFPDWRLSGPALEGPYNTWKVVPIEMARGDTKRAVELALENLVDVEEAVRYRHLYFWKALAQEPAVAVRLAELDAEAKKGREEIWAYIVDHDL